MSANLDFRANNSHNMLQRLYLRTLIMRGRDPRSSSKGRKTRSAVSFEDNVLQGSFNPLPAVVAGAAFPLESRRPVDHDNAA